VKRVFTFNKYISLSLEYIHVIYIFISGKVNNRSVQDQIANYLCRGRYIRNRQTTHIRVNLAINGAV